jgi:hypothetical protein
MLGNLLPSFPQRPENAFPIIQYADDTILIMQAKEDQLTVLKDALHNITLSSGLVVNYHKSCLIPTNISLKRACSLAQVFGCNVGSFPFTYLSIPMGLTKTQVKDYAPLICRIERRCRLLLNFFNMLEGCSWLTRLFPLRQLTICVL